MAIFPVPTLMNGNLPSPHADEPMAIFPVPTLMNGNLSSPHADESMAIFPVPTLMNGSLSSPHADEWQSPLPYPPSSTSIDLAEAADHADSSFLLKEENFPFLSVQSIKNPVIASALC